MPLLVHSRLAGVHRLRTGLVLNREIEIIFRILVHLILLKVVFDAYVGTLQTKLLLVICILLHPRLHLHHPVHFVHLTRQVDGRDGHHLLSIPLILLRLFAPVVARLMRRQTVANVDPSSSISA